VEWRIRRPRGYQGGGHETIGSDILAVVQCVPALDEVVGREMAERLATVQPEAWYPIGGLLELLETLDAKLGPAALRRMGRTLFQRSHEAQFKEVMSSARDVIFGIDDMYRRANRGWHIGGWKVASFEPGHAELENTTPQHCVLEEGILDQALQALGIPVEVVQTECFRHGADHCHFVVTSAIKDALWSGAE
jgi:hypothetical protein